MNKKLITFSIVLVSMFTLISLGGFVFANQSANVVHSSSAVIVPEWTDPLTQVNFTVTVTNNGPDDINEVKITKPTYPYPFTNLICGPAPVGWSMDDPPSYCRYFTSSPEHYIEPGESLDFTLSVKTAEEDGIYVWEVVTWDVPGGWYSTNPTTGIDTVNPDSYVEALPEYETVVVFDIEYVATDETSGVDYVELFYNKDGAGYVSYGTFTSSPISFDTSGTGDGFYEFYTVATDNAGNVEDAPPEADAYTTVDTVDPESYVLPLPEHHNTFVFDIEYVASDETSGVADVELFYNKDGAGYVSYGTFTSSPVSFDASGFGEGYYEFYTIAIDNAGNVEAEPPEADASTTVDLPPEITIYTITNPEFSPNNDSIKDTVTIDLRFSETVDYEINIKDQWETVVKSWSGTAMNPHPKTWDGEFNGSVAPDGVYTIEVIMDDGWNVVIDDSETIILDTVTPTAEVTAPEAYSVVSGIVLVHAEAEDDSTGIDYIDFFRNSTITVLLCTDYEYPYECEWDTTDTYDGDHALWVQAYDNAGNWIISDAVPVIVDNTPPTMDSAITTTVNTIDVEFSEDLDPLTLNYADFSLDVGNVTGASLMDNVITLVVTTMNTDSTPEVTYTQGTLADLAGNLAESGVVMAEDGVAPVMLEAVTRTTTTIDVFFSEDLHPDTVETSDFEVIYGDPLTVISVSLDGHIVTLTVDPEFSVQATPTITLTNVSGGVEDLAGNMQTEGSVIAIDGIAEESGNITITLHTGWNFISVAKRLENPDVSEALAGVNYSIIYTYDPVNGWEIPTTIEPLHGYWVSVNTPVTITLDYAGGIIIPPSRLLYEGWNAIGTTYDDVLDAETALVSIDADYSHVVGWDVINQMPTGPGINGIPPGGPFSNADFNMTPGNGYWVAVTEDTTLMSLTY